MTDAESPSVSRLVGQLRYLFEDEPHLRDAPAPELLARLDHDDRFGRVRATYPNDSDAQAAARLDEFPARIDPARFDAALRQVRSVDDD